MDLLRMSGLPRSRPGPLLPVLGQLGDFEKEPGILALAGVDAKDVLDAHAMARAVDHEDGVVRRKNSLPDDPQVGAGPSGSGELPRKRGVLHPHAELPAGRSGLRDLEKRGSNLPALADESARDVDPRGRQVLAERRKREGASELAFPPSNILDGVAVDRFVGTPMDFAVGLVVALEVHAAGSDRSPDGRLPDGAGSELPLKLELARTADVDGKETKWALPAFGGQLIFHGQDDVVHQSEAGVLDGD